MAVEDEVDVEADVVVVDTEVAAAVDTEAGTKCLNHLSISCCKICHLDYITVTYITLRTVAF